MRDYITVPDGLIRAVKKSKGKCLGFIFPHLLFGLSWLGNASHLKNKYNLLMSYS